MRSLAIIGIGVPGSGKSSFLKQAASLSSNTTYICPDDIRQELCGNVADQTRNPEVWELAYCRIGWALASGNNVILDATHARRSDRIKSIQQCRRSGAGRVEGWWFRTPVDTCIARIKLRAADGGLDIDESVVYRMQAQLDAAPPTLSDGFDEIVPVS